MAGTIKVDTLQSDSNLALKISTANVAFIDSNGLNVVGGNLTLGGIQFAENGEIQSTSIANDAITTSKIADGAVTNDKIVSVANTKIVGTITNVQLGNNLTLNVSTLTSSSNIDFVVGASQNTAFRIEDTGQLYNTIESTTGTDYRNELYPSFTARAWANFNGTNGSIRASGNISSITNPGTGQFYLNFTKQMPDANYAVSSIHSAGAGSGASTSLLGGQSIGTTSTAASANVYTYLGTNPSGPTWVTVVVFR